MLVRSPRRTRESNRASRVVPRPRSSCTTPALPENTSRVAAMRRRSWADSSPARRTTTAVRAATRAGAPHPTVSLWVSSGKTFQAASILLFSLIWHFHRRAAGSTAGDPIRERLGEPLRGVLGCGDPGACLPDHLAQDPHGLLHLRGRAVREAPPL